MYDVKSATELWTDFFKRCPIYLHTQCPNLCSGVWRGDGEAGGGASRLAEKGRHGPKRPWQLPWRTEGWREEKDRADQEPGRGQCNKSLVLSAEWLSDGRSCLLPCLWRHDHSFIPEFHIFIDMNSCLASLLEMSPKRFTMATIALLSLRLCFSRIRLWMSDCSFTPCILNIH